MRYEPLIPKFETGESQYYSKTNEDGTKDRSLIAFQSNGKNRKLGNAYCIAKQPRFVEDGQWETHAKAMSATPKMLRYLIEEWYKTRDKIQSEIQDQHPIPEEELALDDLKSRLEELTEILKEAGAFDEDIW